MTAGDLQAVAVADSVVTEFTQRWNIAKSGLPRYLKEMWKPPEKVHEGAFTPSVRGHHALLACALLGGIGFDLTQLEKRGVPVRRRTKWAERHRSWFLRIVEVKRDELAELVSRALRENVETFEQCLAAIDPDRGLFPYGPEHGQQNCGHWEFEDDIFGLREIVEDARSALRPLGLDEEVERNLERYRSHDETLRAIIPFAVSKIVKFEGMVRPAEWFPSSFWWRRLQWDEYQRPENQAVLQEKARELYRDLIREAL